MNKRLKKLIILIFLVSTIIITGISAVAYAMNAYGDELTSPISAVEQRADVGPEGLERHYGYNFYSISPQGLIQELNSMFNNSTTRQPAELGFEALLSKYANVFCSKHPKGIPRPGNIGATPLEHTFIPHYGTPVNVNNHITPRPGSTNGLSVGFSYTATAFTNGYYSSSDCRYGPCQEDINTTYITESNYLAVSIGSGSLRQLGGFNHYGVDISEETNVPAYASVFSDKANGTRYTSAMSQHAIWGITGRQESYTQSNALFYAGRAVDYLEKELANRGDTPVVTVNDSEHPGAYYMESTDTYRVGPFHMSDYAYAYSPYVINYSGSGLGRYKGLLGGISDGTIILTDDSGNEVPVKIDIQGDCAKIVYEDCYGNKVSKGDANRKSEGVYTDYLPVEGSGADEVYEVYPYPNSTFYIDIPRSLTNKATTLSKLKFTHRKTVTNGSGSGVMVACAVTTWELNNGGSACSNVLCSPHLQNAGHHEGCHSDGDDGTCHHYCGSPAYYCRRHKHHNCTYSKWVPTVETRYGQPALVVQDANVDVKIKDTTSTLNLRLTTNIQIKKYVEKVEHESNKYVTFGETSSSSVKNSTQSPNERKQRDNNGRKNNPVYVEYGDVITFRIDIQNKQNYEVKMKLKDLLPEKIDVLSRTYKNDSSKLWKDYQWISVPGNNTTSLLLKLRTNANDDTLYYNEIVIVTRNSTLDKNDDDNVDFMRTTDSRQGPVINISEIDTPKIKDEYGTEISTDIFSTEYYKINDYNVVIDKYISGYNHEMMDTNNSNVITKESFDTSKMGESDDPSNMPERFEQKDLRKQQYPIPVETTETLTYSVRIINNSDKKGNKVATEIRPEEIVDKLNTGLEFIKNGSEYSITAEIHNDVGDDGEENIELEQGVDYDVEYNQTQNSIKLKLKDTKDEEDVDSDATYLVIQPGGYLLYTIDVKVIESNMNLNVLENTASIEILSNINNGKDRTDETVECTECQGTGEVFTYDRCSICSGTGTVPGENHCDICHGRGKVYGLEPCPDCGGYNGSIPGAGGKIKEYECTSCGQKYYGTKPDKCKNYVGIPQKCNGTTFEEICTICGNTKGQCKHVYYTCTNGHKNEGSGTCQKLNNGNTYEYRYECSSCGDVYSDIPVTSCPDNKYEYYCTNCGHQWESFYREVECPECEWDNIELETTPESGHKLSELKEVTCGNCGKSAKTIDKIKHDKDSDCVCGEPITQEMCSECDIPTSQCTHYEYKCASCGQMYETNPGTCSNESAAKICGNTKFNVTTQNTDELDENESTFCNTCNGSGKVETENGDCYKCNGTGLVGNGGGVTCPECEGRGESITASTESCSHGCDNGRVDDTETSDRIVRNATWYSGIDSDGSNKVNRNMYSYKKPSEYVDYKSTSYVDYDGDGDNEISSDYVRMKDLVISGYVWLDMNRDGYMNDADTKALTEQTRAYYNIKDGTSGKENVTVRLYSVIDGKEQLVRTTKTDNRGRYTFSNYYSGPNTLTWYHDYKNKSYEDYNSANYNDASRQYARNSLNYLAQTDQRIDKATNKDQYGNYTTSSKFIDYYIEFEYDGVLYKSTEYYSGMDNLNNTKNSNDYGKGTAEYLIDSNAAEFKDVREQFNDSYEYISYDVAYANDLDQKGQVVDPQTGAITTPTVADRNDSSAVLSFDKTGHTSQLMENSKRIMTARSFVKNTTRKDLVSQGENPNSWNNNTITNKSVGNTNLLWLFNYRNEYEKEDRTYVTPNSNGANAKHTTKTNYNNPSTEYLKYINLGLELREDVDISLTKDVYKVKTTINGEEMEYTFNQNNGLNGDVPEENKPKYLNNYIIAQPYGLDLYEADYKMRTEQYRSEAVRKYKGLNGQSELNVEVTYRITVANKAINDDETQNKDKTKDTKLNVKINEILDLYDENFREIQFNPDGTMINPNASDNNTSNITNREIVKVKNENGYLEDKIITIGEAWYFRKVTENSGLERYRIDENSVLPLTYNNSIGQVSVASDSKNGQNKPVYVADPNGEYEKVPLTLRKQSYRGTKGQYSYKENDNNFYSDNACNKADGYRTLYITGMGDVLIEEGKDLDIYVKYVLDKESIEMENTNYDDYEETKTITTETETTEKTPNGRYEITKTSNTIKTSDKRVTIDRSLKIAERINDIVVEKALDTARGLEGIAQVNAYSVWYQDGSETALVDMDSNAGNIGNQDTNLIEILKNTKDSGDRDKVLKDSKDSKASKYVSADLHKHYEDMTYKTGIEITADGTEWTKDQINTRWNKKIVEYEENIKDRNHLTRELSGMVWDDSRTEDEDNSTSPRSEEIQYIGDGIYNPSKAKNNKAQINENIKENYKNSKAGKDANKTTPDEEQDIKVRNARAELVEIVEVPQTDGTSRYYEQVLTNVTWDQIQHLRTNDEGKYVLKGFVPGKYIVRFTYGDTVDTLSNEELAYGNTVEQAKEDMQIFNGQDYKSTEYAYSMEEYNKSSNGANTTNGFANMVTTSGTIDEYATNKTENKNNVNSADAVLAALERPNLSDARDDEIRRLDVNNYSEIMINDKAEILKGLANGTENLTTVKLNDDNSTALNYYKSYYQQSDEDKDGTNLKTYQQRMANDLRKLTDNTYMTAETVEFLVRPEKLTYDQTNNSKYIYSKEIYLNGQQIFYDKLETIENKVVKERNYKIENIDMGIEYRPETAINLVKEINNIQLITSDDKQLVNLVVRTHRDDKGNITSHYIDMDASTGAELVQIVSNEYTESPLLSAILDGTNSNRNDEIQQGFIYINVDEELLQGCRVVVQYKFTAQNNSEIDRISNTLNRLRFYGNDRTQELIGIYNGKAQNTSGLSGVNNQYLFKVMLDQTGNEIASSDSSALGKDDYIIMPSNDITNELNELDENKNEYTSNNIARNMVYSDVYTFDNFQDEYRNRPKTMINDSSSNINDSDGTNGYFGKYIAYSYYTADLDSTLDMKAQLKFDKIIDYVDTSLDFGQLSQTDISDLQNIGKQDTTEIESTNILKDVLDKYAIGNQYWINASDDATNNLSKYLFSLNKPFDKVLGTDNNIIDLDGIEYKSLVITTPDKLKDVSDDATRVEGSTETITRNDMFSRFLKSSLETTADNEEESIANIYLPVSKVVSTEEDTENMMYENIAEVIQFTVLTGRRTNFKTTIGNADIHEVDKQVKKSVYDKYGSIEFVTSAYEPDTSSSETITLAPPTGLMRNRKVIYETMETTRNVLQITIIAIAVIAVVFVGTKFTIHKIKKRRYK